MLLRSTCACYANTAYFSTSISKSQTSVTTTRNRKARQMKFELVESDLPGRSSVPAGRPTQAPARLAARGYTFTTVGSAGR